MPTSDPRRLFTERADVYARFIRAVGYSAGLRAFWRKSALLRSGDRVLEAGCGTGALTLALRGAAAERGLALTIDGFDLTPAMLERLRATLAQRAVTGVRLAEADVRRLDALPADWRGYDLVVSAAMLEYVARADLPATLRGLGARLRPGGELVLFMTRRNPLTRMLIGYWWQSHLYTAAELAAVFARAGFTDVRFLGFPLVARHLALWGHVVAGRYAGSDAMP